MQKIVPHLWFNNQAKEAAAFYAATFPDSKVTHQSVIRGTPSGDCDIVSFDVMGHSFMGISAGPYFEMNPSISFFVNFDPSRDPDARAKLDLLWGKLIDGGEALMPLDRYPFSERYGWVRDRFGVSWQLILTNPAGEPRPAIVPCLLFTNEVSGKAEEATDFYISVFPNSKRGALVHYEEDMGPHKKGNTMFTDFQLAGQWLAAMDGGAGVHTFGFNEGVSLLVSCDTQEEIDRYWEALSAVPEAEQCGWLKDRYGVSWQINSSAMQRALETGTPEEVDRLVQAFLKMKKFDLAALERARKGE
jgi:predicted 3-demethylubiquinone-9 3-methyltransferase (glyoxalase superfamily)